MPALRAARSHTAMSIPAMACAIGPISPVCSTSTSSSRESVRNVSSGAASVRPASRGPITSLTSRARCSAPTVGKLLHASPQPSAPSLSTTRTSTDGRSRKTPNATRNGCSSGARKQNASTAEICIGTVGVILNHVERNRLRNRMHCCQDLSGLVEHAHEPAGARGERIRRMLVELLCEARHVDLALLAPLFVTEEAFTHQRRLGDGRRHVQALDVRVDTDLEVAAQGLLGHLFDIEEFLRDLGMLLEEIRTRSDHSRAKAAGR